jgi:iron(III) transport system substrate-binding protein
MSKPLAPMTATLALSAFLAAPVLAQEITVYSSLEDEEIAAYLEVAQQEMPDLTINVLRLSTGDMGARLIAEAATTRRPTCSGALRSPIS